MKRLLLILAFTSTCIAIFGNSLTQTVDNSLVSFIMIAPTPPGESTSPFESVVEVGVGAGYRARFFPYDYGFYHGPDATVGFGFFTRSLGTENIPHEPRTGANFFSTFIFELKYPFGYRWHQPSKKRGFHLGAGPQFSAGVRTTYPAEFGFGLVSELGWESNKLKKGFTFNFQFGFCPIVYRGGYGLFGIDEGGGVYTIAFRFGRTWRETRSPSD